MADDAGADCGGGTGVRRYRHGGWRGQRRLGRRGFGQCGLRHRIHYLDGRDDCVEPDFVAAARRGRNGTGRRNRPSGPVVRPAAWLGRHVASAGRDSAFFMVFETVGQCGKHAGAISDVYRARHARHDAAPRPARLRLQPEPAETDYVGFLGRTVAEYPAELCFRIRQVRHAAVGRRGLRPGHHAGLLVQHGCTMAICEKIALFPPLRPAGRLFQTGFGDAQAVLAAGQTRRPVLLSRSQSVYLHQVSDCQIWQ